MIESHARVSTSQQHLHCVPGSCSCRGCGAGAQGFWDRPPHQPSHSSKAPTVCKPCSPSFCYRLPPTPNALTDPQPPCARSAPPPQAIPFLRPGTQHVPAPQSQPPLVPTVCCTLQLLALINDIRALAVCHPSYALPAVLHFTHRMHSLQSFTLPPALAPTMCTP